MAKDQKIGLAFLISVYVGLIAYVYYDAVQPMQTQQGRPGYLTPIW
jgi:hypothetical protein